MSITITIEPADQPEVIALIDALDAFQKPLYPPESHYGIDITALSQPNVVFLVARDGSGGAVACGAVVVGRDGDGVLAGELKRMVTAEGMRGRGVASALLQRLEHEAIARGCGRLQLETGCRQPDAIRLYGRHGFVRCGPFASYPDDPYSVFMVKHLTEPAPTQVAGPATA